MLGNDTDRPTDSDGVLSPRARRYRAERGLLAVLLHVIEVDAVRERRWADLMPGRCAHLWVRDNGCGMDAATRARIFEPLSRPRASARAPGSGWPSCSCPITPRPSTSS